jgi:integrase
MGRKKKGYKAPQGLVKMPGSPYWWIVWKGIRKSTSIPLSDLTKATILLLEVQKRWYEKQDKAREILGDSVSFSALIDRYLKEVSVTKKSGRSDHTNSVHPLKYFGNRPIDTIEPQDIYKYFEWRKNQRVLRTKQAKVAEDQKPKQVSGPTMNREKSLISDAFSKAIKWGYVKTNPVREIEGFKENKRDRYITDEEFKAIQEVARSITKAGHLPDIMDTLYYTVQRSGKIFTLRWSQVNLEERRMFFSDGSETKGVPDEIWINQPLYEILLRLKAQRPLQKV